MISLHRRFAVTLLPLLVLALTVSAAGIAQARQAQERVLTKQTIKKVAKSPFGRFQGFDDFQAKPR